MVIDLVESLSPALMPQPRISGPADLDELLVGRKWIAFSRQVRLVQCSAQEPAGGRRVE